MIKWLRGKFILFSDHIKIKKLIVVFALIFILCGCVGPQDYDAETQNTPVQPNPEPPTLHLDYGHRINVDGDVITRFVDVDAGVVCYMYKSWKYKTALGLTEFTDGMAGGISCLPLSETNLDY